MVSIGMAVEHVETAARLHRAGQRSLVLDDNQLLLTSAVSRHPRSGAETRFLGNNTAATQHSRTEPDLRLSL